MSFLLYLSFILFLIVSLFLILLVLIQKGRGGGLSSAFGGVGGHTAFGSKTGDVLTWATSIVFAVFLILSVITGLVFERMNTRGRPRPPVPTTPPIQAPVSEQAPRGAPAETAPEAARQPVPDVPNQVPPPAGDPGAAGGPGPTTRP